MLKAPALFLKRSERKEITIKKSHSKENSKEKPAQIPRRLRVSSFVLNGFTVKNSTAVVHKKILCIKLYCNYS